MSEDYWERVFLPDVYPRKDDPFQPRGASISEMAPPASLNLPPGDPSADIYTGWITDPGVRPVVYQRALNFSLSVTAVAQPITATQFQADAIVIDVPSTAANSVFVGYSSGVSTISGIEVQKGLPVTISPDNTREQWELQRALEAMAAMLGYERGLTPPGPFRAPRVCLDTSAYYLIGPAATTTVVSIMLFLIPEMQ